MTILAETPLVLVEYEALGRMLTITDKSTGKCKALTGPSIAGDFRDCLKTHNVHKVIDVWLRIARDVPWQPLYKPKLWR